VIAILVAAAYIGLRYLWIEKSFYVGVNDAGNVTIYRGVPQDLAGMTLHREEEETSLAAADLPSFLQDDLEAGIETDSLGEAQQRVEDLEERATDEEFERPENQKDDGAGDGSGGGDKN
jgi:protein phosphatase